MSTNDYILNLLIIKDKNINILSNNIISKNINGKSTKIIQGVNVSTSSVNRIMDYISSNTVLRHEHLPSSMNFDEFKTTKDTSGKMAFIIVNNISGDVFDILDSRKSNDLFKYFLRYQKKDRDNVKFISTDFYYGYISLSEKLFKNANIVIDIFHIVTQVYNALNINKVKLCHKSNPNYNKLKHYWKLIVKNQFDLSHKKFYSSYLKKYISQKEIVTYLINTDSTLKATYECYQGIINSIKNKEFRKFKNIIHHPNKLISDKMKHALKLYRQYEKYIENYFIYDINNGVIEGTNNLIKCVKRIAFDYKKFKHLSTRVLLIKGIIKEG